MNVNFLKTFRAFSCLIKVLAQVFHSQCPLDLKYFKKKKKEYFKEGIYLVLNSVVSRLIQKLIGWRRKITHFVWRSVLEPCTNLGLLYEGSSSGVIPNPGFYGIMYLFQAVVTWNELVNDLNRFCLNCLWGGKRKKEGEKKKSKIIVK